MSLADWSANADMVLLIEVLALMALAAGSAWLRRTGDRRLPWHLLAGFGLAGAIASACEIVALGVSESVLVADIHLACTGLSFLFLAGFAAAALRGRTGPAPALILVTLLFAGAVSGVSLGIPGLAVTVRYALALPGGMGAAVALWTTGRGSRKEPRSLLLAAISLAVYAATAGAFPPRAPFFPASVLNEQAFLFAAGFPMAVLRALALCGAALAVSRLAERHAATVSFRESGRRSRVLIVGATTLLLVATGWGVISRLGRAEDSRQRNLLMDMSRNFVLTLDPAELSNLTATSADLDTPSYHRLKTHLHILLENMPNGRFVYLMRRVEGTWRFLADSEPPGSKDESPAGEIYSDDCRGLDAAWSTGTARVEGPLPDAWGVWVSSVVPVRASLDDPVTAVLGIDQDATAFKQAVFQERLKGILILLVLLATGLSSLLLHWRFRREILRVGSEGHADRVLHWGTPALIVLAGISLSLPLLFWVHRNALDAFETDLRQRSIERIETIAAATDHELTELNGVARLFECSDLVERHEFRHYVTGVITGSPAVEAIGWAPRVRAADRDEYERRARTEGGSGFRIREQNGRGAGTIAGDPADCYPVVYLEPERGGAIELGLDLASNPAFRDALASSAESGLPTATAPVRLRRDPAGSTVFLIVSPIFAPGQRPEDAAERRARLQGFALGIYRADDLLQAALINRPILGLDVTLEDLEAPPGERELCHHQPRGPEAEVSTSAPAYQGFLEVAGRNWRVLVTPGSTFVASEFSRVYRWILPLGLILSGLIAAVISQILWGRFRAEHRNQQLRALMKVQELLNERFALAAESAGIGVWELDPATGHLVWDEQMHRLYGVSPAEFEGTFESWQRWVHPDDQPRLQAEIQRAWRDHHALDTEFRSVSADGEIRHLRAHARVTGELASGSNRITGVSYDITERKRAEEALRESDRQYRLLAENVSDLIWVMDVESRRFLYVSPSVERLRGFTVEEAMDEGVADTLTPRSLDLVNRELPARLAEFEAGICLSYLDRLENIRKDGSTVWTETLTRMSRDRETGRVELYGTSRDISERKHAEEERAEMEVQLRHAQKMESIGRLAAGIAHEINTPTQFIGDNNRFLQEAFAELQAALSTLPPLLAAVEEGEIPPALLADIRAAIEATDLDYLMAEIPKALEQSLEGVSRVARIVRAMKEFSHPSDEEKVPADLNAAIESTVTVCRNEWKYVADLVTDFDPDLRPFPCLIGDLNQVVLNLVINAAHSIGEAMGDRGEPRGTISVSTRRDGDWAEIRVADTGAGIPENLRESIFTPFFTTKPVGKGTGQGLAIARSVVVEKHGGTIRFESEVGRGTTFIVRLPTDPFAVSGETDRLAA